MQEFLLNVLRSTSHSFCPQKKLYLLTRSKFCQGNHLVWICSEVQSIDWWISQWECRKLGQAVSQSQHRKLGQVVSQSQHRKLGQVISQSHHRKIGQSRMVHNTPKNNCVWNAGDSLVWKFWDARKINIARLWIFWDKLLNSWRDVELVYW